MLVKNYFHGVRIEALCELIGRVSVIRQSICHVGMNGLT